MDTPQRTVIVPVGEFVREVDGVTVILVQESLVDQSTIGLRNLHSQPWFNQTILAINSHAFQAIQSR